MSQKRHKSEGIVAKLKQVDVLVSQGRSVPEAVRWHQPAGAAKVPEVRVVCSVWAVPIGWTACRPQKLSR